MLAQPAGLAFDGPLAKRENPDQDNVYAGHDAQQSKRTRIAHLSRNADQRHAHNGGSSQDKCHFENADHWTHLTALILSVLALLYVVWLF